MSFYTKHDQNVITYLCSQCGEPLPDPITADVWPSTVMIFKDSENMGEDNTKFFHLDRCWPIWKAQLSRRVIKEVKS